MDFLNDIYGGQVARSGYMADAQQQEYAAKIAGMNRQNVMYGGFLSAGTTALTGVSNYGLARGWFLPTKPTPSNWPYPPVSSTTPNLGP